MAEDSSILIGAKPGPYTADGAIVEDERIVLRGSLQCAKCAIEQSSVACQYARSNAFFR